MLQWGNMTLSKPLQEQAYKVLFNTEFPEKCLNINLTLQSSEGSDKLDLMPQPITSKITKTGFEFFLQYYYRTEDIIYGYEGDVSVSYIAIGY